jgi:hypothetical protein
MRESIWYPSRIPNQADEARAMSQQQSGAEARMNADDLYREDTYTDRQVGTLRVLTPVTREGAEDASRAVIYQGQAQIMTNMGPLPIAFEIPGANLGEAVEGFAAASQQAIERTMREIQDMRREAASQIVVPEAGGGGMGGLRGMGGMPGGGKIQMP